MAIFKKAPLQGNFILANGNQILFEGGYYETEKDSEISQLKEVYEQVDSKPEVQAAATAPVKATAKLAPAANTGMTSSASIVSNTK